ncbi:MAG TPA: Rho termination factor N-terminal domain-containing protein [Miltoncostaeaceae bacterium]|nr:Rho termination factor N-terminal domain-containing protein [Miltoncostaeaceae bacterium]
MATTSRSRPAPEPDDLAGLTVAELRDRARTAGVDRTSGMKKGELLEALRAASAGPAGGAKAEPAPSPGPEESADGPTTLDEKLGEVIGLARAACDALERVAGLAGDDDTRRELLARMREETEAVARRGEEALDGLGARADAVREFADETADEARGMMETYLGDDAELLDGFEFLIMAEAGEIGHWLILRTLNRRAGDPLVGELAEAGIPVKERHFAQVVEAALALAAEEDPAEPA